MATLVFRPSRITTIGPTLIIPDIILVVLIGDGEVIGDITVTTTTIISIGVIIDQVIITKTTTMAINDTINGVVTATTVATTVRRVTMDPAYDDKLIARTGGQMGSENLKT